MAISEGSQLLAGDLHAVLDRVKANVLQIAKKWDWRWMLSRMLLQKRF